MERIIDMEKDKVLSIIVPIYNVENYLERCIMSLLEQDVPHDEYEIILVNDGSTDSSYEIASHMVQQHENLVLLTQENQGLSCARNAGLKAAAGQYLMFVDSDDWIECNSIGGVLKQMRKKQLDLCFFNFCCNYPDGREDRAAPQSYDEQRVYDGEALMLNGMAVSSVWRCMYRSDFLFSTDILFTPCILHEDIDFNFKLYPLAKRVMFAQTYVYHYRILCNSIMRSPEPAMIKKRIEGNLYVSASICSAMQQEVYSPAIRRMYRRHINSIVTSMLVKIVKDHSITATDKADCLTLAKHLALYPVKGLTMSWKTTLLAHLLLNREWFFCRLLR